MSEDNKAQQDFFDGQIALFLNAVALGLKRVIVPNQMSARDKGIFYKSSLMYPSAPTQVQEAQQTIDSIAREKRFDASAFVLFVSDRLASVARRPSIWSRHQAPKNMSDPEAVGDAVERAGHKIISGLLDFLKAKKDSELLDDLADVHRRYHLKATLREPLKPPPATPLPYKIRAMRHMAKERVKEALEEARTWSQRANKIGVAPIKRQTQWYLRALVDQLIAHANKEPLSPARVFSADKAFSENHPNADEHFGRLGAAIERMIRDPETRGWARTTRVDLENPENARKLFGYFAERLDQILWENDLYPHQAMKKAMHSPLERQNFEAAIVADLIKRLEDDKKFVFSNLFPRNRHGIAALPRPKP